jgi:chromosome partitioning protein
MAKKIVFISDKGGISKTDTTYTCGVGLALQGKKVLLVGADMKTDLNTRANSFSKIDYLHSFINGGIFLEPQKLENYDNLSILPRSQRFLDEQVEVGTFKQILAKHDQMYDYILIDTTANLGRAAKDCLFSSDASIILTDHDVLSFDGVHQLMPDIAFCKENTNPNHK